MDAIARLFDRVQDNDLSLCERHGIAYQTRTGKPIPYDENYMAKVDSYDGSAIANAVNAGRCAMLARHLQPGASVLDYGAGSGAFVRDANAAGFGAKGFDVMHGAIERLLSSGLYAYDPHEFDAVTFWDSLEHMEDPSTGLKSIKKGAYAFASLPVFEDLHAIRTSKHYRPNEHLCYFTTQGFIDWMAIYGFRLLEQSNHETDAGRESIGAFAFCRDLPDYHDHIAAYREMHSTRFYGSSAVELHLDSIASVVADLKPMSILDYGCGRSDLVAHFWRDGKRRIARYDPAIPTYKTMPPGQFDLVLCCDVLEHIPMQGVSRVLLEVRGKGNAAVFTISTKPARAKLPDGRNAHVTLLTKTEWLHWIGELWTDVKEIPSKWEHELIVVAR